MSDAPAPHLERAFDLQVAERTQRIRRIDGTFPSAIRGSYYVNGPARFARGDLRYRHWLDGDGMVCALHFDDEGVRFANRFVRSSKFVAEEEAGRALFRTFGTAFPSDELAHGIGLQSPVNVAVYPFNGRLLAFGEQGLPWSLDPESLETLGEYNFGGRLNAISSFSAHVRIDPDSGDLYNFGVSFASRTPKIQVYRFNARGESIYRKRINLEHPCSMHDFNLAPNHIVFHVAPHLLDMQRLMESGATVMDSLSWEPELGSRLLIAAREDASVLAEVPLPATYCLHHINAFEQGGNLVVDIVELDRPVYDQYQVIPDLFRDPPLGRPVRLILDTENWKVVERTQIDCSVALDFPAIDSRRNLKPYEDLWMLAISRTAEPGRKFFDQLLHLSWERPHSQDAWTAPPGHYLGGEPAFVADPGNPSGGWIICQLFDGPNEAGAFYLFDAYEVARGPVCTLWLDQPIPPLFHSWFEPAGK
jgi:all-trans-8'-apo-beta-carotenal 15,15'-oxygenase